MANSLKAAQEQLIVLRKAYAQQIPSRVAQMKEVWKDLLESWDQENLDTLHRMTHTLAGSGATFGFEVLSDTANTLELFLRAIISNGYPPTVEQQTQINALLDSLQEASGDLHPSAYVYQLVEQTFVKHPLISTMDERLILLVDEDVFQAQTLALQISYFGYTVEILQHWTEIQAAVLRKPPSAIIMDIVFADGNLAGTEMITTIQRLRDRPIPILFMSERDDLGARLQAARAGGEAYLIKPIDVGYLVDKLDRLTTHQPAEPYRILIVEDDSALAAYYALILQRVGMIAVVVSDPLQIMQPLSEFKPDLILMDVYMPGCNGLELAAVIRQQEAYVGIPIMFLSMETNLDKQMVAMSLGGDDFLTKPIQPDHLLSAVTTRVQRSRILHSFMVRDSLTGLFNHTKTKEQLTVEVRRAQRQNTNLAFAMLDIDHFKSINDNYGHLTGDRVIKNLARLLQQRLRKTDFIGRFGGEEFAVILTDTDGPTALKVLDGIRQGFEQVRHQYEGVEFSVTFSCGIATFPTYLEAIKLNDAADKALYTAKHAGRNQVVLARECC
ncbi:MAG: diguanylate cyclase [Leptolyngbyaceae bacterium]|nr:diguanylate cyclase [Leptolyngbyaceae bacterium]